MDIVTKAVVYATMAHFGQRDLAGQDYITHPLRVATALENESPEVRAVAFLHDVLEDTDYTAADLLAAGFPLDVVEAVQCLTKNPGEQRETYWERIKSNPIALQVKLADIADNNDPDRLAKLNPDKAAQLATKYAQALSALTS